MTEIEPQPEIQTADEIANEFPDEWIVMKVVSLDENTYHGFPIYHSKNHSDKEIMDAAQVIEKSGGKVYLFHGSTRLLSNTESIQQFEEDSLDQLLADMGKYELEEQ